MGPIDIKCPADILPIQVKGDDSRSAELTEPFTDGIKLLVEESSTSLATDDCAERQHSSVEGMRPGPHRCDLQAVRELSSLPH